jgi:hypothetical protein
MTQESMYDKILEDLALNWEYYRDTGEGEVIQRN